jgi:uncharacterized membrane-anchored protein
VGIYVRVQKLYTRFNSGFLPIDKSNASSLERDFASSIEVSALWRAVVVVSIVSSLIVDAGGGVLVVVVVMEVDVDVEVGIYGDEEATREVAGFI